MKAMVQDEYGSPDVLRLEDVDVPRPGAGEVLVRVRAAGVSRAVWHLVTGRPLLIRLAGFGVRRPKRPVPGGDVAGVVEAVGPDVTGIHPGDPVLGPSTSAFAEYACVRADRLVPLPAGIPFEQAAAVPDSATTALLALRDQGRVRSGQRVLVLGASGGVGTFAVQLAKAFGADVTGVSSAAKADLVRSLGADRVLDYARDEIGGGYDLVLDIGGNRPVSRLRRMLTDRGTLVIVGGEGGDRWSGGMSRQLTAVTISPFVRQRLRFFVSRIRQDDLRILTGMLAAGTLRPAIDRTFALAELPEALRRLESGRVRGKLVVTV